ncbi:transcriptional regulator, TetR family [Paracoccus halophilus]|uniref:Transcriptional regulator, TetR family n=1 Tax=Paracoccus halophilus TaxID=376733 RepID=A0A099F4G4_9RHOB|nr:TetR family transcriptional regulator [Paracoccus halophilus]KGJ05620.1 hypothetical protein IT41_05250 [Paracoccus halophilus]SFA47456.1 transcriptional regulator, TetR family [Paracoccus halophilus]
MRRTKEEAEQTRTAILDVAEHIFAEKGVSSASLESISRAAGVTRGAFYWHFKDKTDLLTALRARRLLPQEGILAMAAEQGYDDPLGLLEAAGHEMLAIFEVDESQQRMFRILSHMVEDEETARCIRDINNQMFELLRRIARQARSNGTLSPDFTPEEAAVLMMSTMHGLLSEWLRSAKAFPLSVLGWKILSSQMSLLRGCENARRP